MSGALPTELRPEGRRDSNPRLLDPRRNPRLRNRPTSNFKVHDNVQRHRVAARPGLEPGPPGSEPGVVPLPPPRMGLAWSGRRDSNSQPPASDTGALPVAPRPGVHVGTDGGSRTRTDGGLSAAPLPVGLRQRVRVCRWTVRDSNPQPSPCRGAALPVAPPAQWSVRWSRGRESNPRRGAYETPLHPVPSQCDRPDSNRLPPGPRPGVSTTSDLGHRRRGGIRTPGFLCVRQAVCQLTYSS